MEWGLPSQKENRNRLDGIVSKYSKSGIAKSGIAKKVV
jgi:hypothetical protein